MKKIMVVMVVIMMVTLGVCHSGNGDDRGNGDHGDDNDGGDYDDADGGDVLSPQLRTVCVSASRTCSGSVGLCQAWFWPRWRSVCSASSETVGSFQRRTSLSGEHGIISYGCHVTF